MSQRRLAPSTPHHLLWSLQTNRYRGAFFGFTLALFLTVIALAGCSVSPTTSARSAPSPQITATPTVPATIAGFLALRARQAVGTVAKQVDVTYQATDQTAAVNIMLVWSPAWKTDFSLAQAKAKLACYQAQTALWTSGVPLSKVTVLVQGQALDDYSSVITSAYAEADITAQHAKGVAWSTISAEQAWTLYDQTFLRPTYAPDWIYPPPSN